MFIKLFKQYLSKFNTLNVYTSITSVVGIVVLIWSLTNLSSSWSVTILFVILILIIELTTTSVFADSLYFSMSASVSLATLLLFGAPSAILVTMAGGLAFTVMTEINGRRTGRERANFVQRTLFNSAASGIAMALAAQVYISFSTTFSLMMLIPNIGAILLTAIIIEFVNAAIVIGVVSIQSKQSPILVWKQNVSWAVPINILGMIIGGSGLAIGYLIAGILGLAVYLLPIALTIYAFRLYVSQTKAQMDRLEEIVATRTEELQRLDQVKTTFFSVINHEMRTPLSSITGFTEILLDRGDLDSNQERMVHLIQLNGEKLLELVNALLDIARLEDGNLKILPKKIRLEPVIRTATDVLRPAAAEKEIAVDIQVKSNLPKIHGDANRLNQVLLNLLSNAIKYTPKQGRVIVAVKSNEARKFVEVTVSDTGIGIPASEIPYIFDRFNRVERAEIEGIVGTGLGLFITKGLIEAHGGEIHVNSEEGQGTCVTFTLPALPKSA